MKGIALRYGGIMFAGFTLYFLLMQSLELSDNYYYRVLNGIIHLVVIALAISKYKNAYPEDFNYLTGVSTGLVTSVVGVLPFTLFLLIFLFKSPDLMEDIIARSDGLSQYLNPYTASLVVMIEGLAVSAVGSYVIMRIVDSYR